MFATLAAKSLWHRKASVLMSVLALTVSIFVLLGVEHIRLQSKENFSRAASSTDLVVGARTGRINLLLYSIFHIGTANNNVSWESYQSIIQNPTIKWSIPLSMGDSHKGFRVVASNSGYFRHFRYGENQPLTFKQGGPFEKIFDIVLGADVAQKLNYNINDRIHLAHGLGATSFKQHKSQSFIVRGILSPTGTAVDRAILASLAGIEIIHDDTLSRSLKNQNPTLESSDITPKSITAFMLGLDSKLDIFKLQRDISNYSSEPLLAILPGVTLKTLWQMTGALENTLRLISILVLVSALLGLLALQLANTRERELEIKLLRIVGASPYYLFFLIQLEAIMITFISIILSCVSLYLTLNSGQSYLATQFGVYINSHFFNNSTLSLLTLVLLATCLAATIPALATYKKSLLYGS